MIINIIIVIIFVLSVVYSFKYKFIQLNFIKESKLALKNNSSKTSFMLSLGSHIGAGNILGVTSGLIIVGPGILFWMSLCTFFTTIFSLIENTLGLKYRKVIDGEGRGGSPYYIKYGLNKNKLALIFSFFLVLSSSIFFLPIQVNGISFSLKYIFNIDNNIIFLLLFVFIILFVFSGTNILIKVVNKIVPVMTILFLIICFYAIIIKFDYIDDIITLIIKDAFNFKKGILSGIIIAFKRSIFSNEAGLGTAPSINCYSNNSPLKQGYLQVLTCFIDTIVMCVLLGIVILLYDIDLINCSGNVLAILIFDNIIPYYGKFIGSLLLFFFSLATIISSFYAGETNILFIGINKKIKNIYLKNIYKVLFIIGIIIGIYFNNSLIWNLVDYGLVILGVINIGVIIKLENLFRIELYNENK